MASKKATGAAGAKAKGASTSGSHASYKDMIKDAIINSLTSNPRHSRQAIKKYIHSNNQLGSTTDASFNSHISTALASGVKTGDFEMPKGPSGPTKLAKKGSAKPATATKTEKKPAVKKAAPAKKASSTTKTKTTTTKAKTPTKANVGKKAAPKKVQAAPAVEAKEARVTGKTKTGRVTKSSAPPAAAKKAAARTTSTKKAAAKTSA
ncbi:MAG: hypothetical protein M1828_003661 [Chrysothrix sp. TS-e1954]|nr:MAG: hypothetical protein M1828_003661 [Chrysothrix sp. TS-e1954]